jgi:signal transduction histidine kinase
MEIPKFIKLLVTPPMVDLKVRQRILMVLLGIALIGVVVVLVSEIARDPSFSSAPAFLAFLAVLILCGVMTRQRRLNLPSWTLSIGLLLLLTENAYTHNGIHDLTVIFFPVLMVFSSVLLSRWGSILVAFLASLALILLTFCEISGLIITPFASKTDFADIIPLLTAIWATQSFQWVLMGNFWRDLVSARGAETSARELSQELEQRVAERTQQLEQANAELAQSNSQLEAANRELEAFSYSVSHDLRAPLRAINGFSSALAEDYSDTLPPAGMGYLEIIRRNTLHMSDLIDGMLKFSRTSRQPLELCEVQMESLARQALAQVQEECDIRPVNVTFGFLPDCRGDAMLLRQVWYNLLSNAFKFTRKCEAPRIEVGAQNDDGGMVYFVRDNGSGFDMQYAARLFGVFQRLHRSEEFEGTGVGLAIAKRILQRHGGRIWAEAKPGEGAVFYFTL